MFFGEYEKLDVIGHGASGYVYKVNKGGELYAVKACTGMDNESLRRFDREIRIAQSLNHPNIIHVYDFDMGASNPYFVMELCDEPVSRVIQSKSFEELLELSLEICEGVKALHDAGVIHRDIKPANILIKSGRVRLTDFSFGAFVDHDSTTITTSNQLIGTSGYIAPEIFSQGGHYATILSDIYSLGCTLWYMFSGGIDPNYYKAQELSPNMVRIIEKCRENEPSARYNSVQELIEELKALQTPIQYMSIKDLLAQESKLSKAEVRTNAFQLLMRNDQWNELINDIRLLGDVRLNDIIKNVPEAGTSIILLLENIYHNDTENWRQFDDVETFTNLCAQVFGNTNDVLTKQKAIDLTLEFSINYNRWPAMRIIREKMLNRLSDDESRLLSGFLRANKDMLIALEESIGSRLNRNVRLAAGMA